MSYFKALAIAVVAVLAAANLVHGGLLGGGGYGRGPAGGGAGFGGAGGFGGGAFGGGGFGGAYGGGYGPAQPYNFQYAVRDAFSGSDFSQHERGHGGNVNGEYQVRLPDGRNQIVTYTASDATGYVANVQYQGEPHYPSGPFRGGAGGGFGGGFGGSGTYLPPHGK